MLAKNIDLRNKTVLVTGAAGFIGANLVLELLKHVEGIKIIGLDSMNALSEWTAWMPIMMCA